MRRVLGVLFSFCFLVFSFTIILAAQEVEKLIIEQDTVITEDTTWTEKDVVINEGVTFIVKNATLTIKEGNFINKGSFIVENANLVRESKIWKSIYNYGILEFNNSTIDFIVYLYKDSILSADSSKLVQIYFHGDNAHVMVNNCDISRLHPRCKVTVKVTGKCKINVLDICIGISDNAKVTYVNNEFTEKSQGYVIPEVSVSSETETRLFGYGMSIGESARATIKQSQLLYLDVYKDSEAILNDCNLLSTQFGGTLNHGGVFIATNCSFRWVETIDENALSTLTNCTVTGYVMNTKGKTHLINTNVAGTLYEDKTLVEGERLPPVEGEKLPLKDGFSFYVLQGEFIQTTGYEYEVCLERGGKESVDANITLIPSFSSYHFSQKVLEQNIEYSETPDKITTIEDKFGIRYQKAEWRNPPSEITIKRTAKCKNIVSYAPFITQSKYPLDSKALPSNIKKYLNPGPFVQCDDPEIRELSERIVKGAESEMDAVVKIINWVRHNVLYTCSKDLKVCEGVSFADAKRTLKYRKGNCVNFASLSIALLRAAGIPTKWSRGKVADSEYESGSCHSWISVYIPEKGFVEFESSYWIPRSGLVPETILMPQHICFGSFISPIGVANTEFHELHRSTQEVTSRPQKKTHISESINKEDIISFLASVEEKGSQVYGISFKAIAPPGWKVFFSNETVKIESPDYRSKEILITIIPPSDIKSGDEAEIKIIADDGSKQKEILFSISIY